MYVLIWGNLVQTALCSRIRFAWQYTTLGTVYIRGQNRRCYRTWSNLLFESMQTFLRVRFLSLVSWDIFFLNSSSASGELIPLAYINCLLFTFFVLEQTIPLCVFILWESWWVYSVKSKITKTFAHASMPQCQHITRMLIIHREPSCLDRLNFLFPRLSTALFQVTRRVCEIRPNTLAFKSAAASPGTNVVQ